MEFMTYNKLKNRSMSEGLDRLKRIYFDALLGNIDDADIKKLLSVIVIFSNQSDEILKKMAYRMALSYGISTQDLVPLYDVAINNGLFPVAELIERILQDSRVQDRRSILLSELMAGHIESYRFDGDVLTSQQRHLRSFFLEDEMSTKVVVAPTSYGKSELIVQMIENFKCKRICIIVPSKALLAQTKRRILDEGVSWVKRVISNPDLYKSDDVYSVYVLTQERLTRLLNKNKDASFDFIVVDEAHNLFDMDVRSGLLASVLRILYYRNRFASFNFLTPFISSPASLQMRDGVFGGSSCYVVDEYVKSEVIYLADFRGDKREALIYDHFLDEFHASGFVASTVIEYIEGKALEKNVIYFNKPKDVQDFSSVLASSLPNIAFPDLDKILDEISLGTHDKYLLISCLRKGVVYHHGSMTDSVRAYVEYIYKSHKDVRYLVTTSTLLEGVNLPIDRMFILDIGKGRGYLGHAQFKNLIGRVSRFNRVFNPSAAASISGLMPEIHIIGTEGYLRDGANLTNFLKRVMYVNSKPKDDVKNVMLAGAEMNLDQYSDIIDRLENIEPGIGLSDSYREAKTRLGLSLLENNITEIDVYGLEVEINEKITGYIERNGVIADTNSLMKVIGSCFASFMKDGEGLKRLEGDKAQSFYAMFMDWKIRGASLKEMIFNFVKYWDGLQDDNPVFVGKWGEVALEGFGSNSYVYISGKNTTEKINLAIVRIKEEDDFFDFKILRFIDVLHEIGAISEDFFEQIKYGDSDANTRVMIDAGYTRGLAELLIKKYYFYLKIDDGDVIVNPEIHERLVVDGVGFMQRHEVMMNVGK